jgi:foldase protein PrsA
MKSWFGWIGIGTGIIVAGASVAAFKLRTERPIVVINGEKISRGQFLAELEKSDGATVLRRMIQEQLVLQQAKKKGLMPTSQQINAEIDTMREGDPDLDRQLRLRGKTMEELKHDLRGRLAAANLIASEVKVPDSVAKTLWLSHQKQFNRPEGRKVEMVIARSNDIGEKARRLMADGIPAEFASQNTGMALPGGRSQILLYKGQLPASLENTVFSLKTGTVSQVLPLGSAFAVVKVVEEIPARQKKFDEVKDRLLLTAKLQKGKSQPELVQALQKQAKIEFKSERYAGLKDTALAAPDPRATRVARAR